MKAAPFSYEDPDTLEETLDLLARHGDEARILAGGQSLVPALNLRLTRPSVVIDINRIRDLDRLESDGRTLTAGPLVRHRALESPPAEGPLGELLSHAAHLIAHPPIRTRGTMVGSLAFGDPAAEWCVIALLLDAVVTAANRNGVRQVKVEDLLSGAFRNSLAPDELLVEARFPIPSGVAGSAIVEQSHTKGDFAVVVAAAMVMREADRLHHRVAVGGAAPTAARLRALEAELDREPALAKDHRALADLMSEVVDPPADNHGSAEYRTHLAAVLTQRALEKAAT